MIATKLAVLKFVLEHGRATKRRGAQSPVSEEFHRKLLRAAYHMRGRRLIGIENFEFGTETGVELIFDLSGEDDGENSLVISTNGSGKV
jgi:hypothetical protein